VSACSLHGTFFSCSRLDCGPAPPHRTVPKLSNQPGGAPISAGREELFPTNTALWRCHDTTASMRLSRQVTKKILDLPLTSVVSSSLPSSPHSMLPLRLGSGRLAENREFSAGMASTCESPLDAAQQVCRQPQLKVVVQLETAAGSVLVDVPLGCGGSQTPGRLLSELLNGFPKIPRQYFIFVTRCPTVRHACSRSPPRGTPGLAAAQLHPTAPSLKTPAQPGGAPITSGREGLPCPNTASYRCHDTTASMRLSRRVTKKRFDSPLTSVAPMHTIRNVVVPFPSLVVRFRCLVVSLPVVLPQTAPPVPKTERAGRSWRRRLLWHRHSAKRSCTRNLVRCRSPMSLALPQKWLPVPDVSRLMPGGSQGVAHGLGPVSPHF
jgi:hypothetical protein